MRQPAVLLSPITCSVRAVSAEMQPDSRWRHRVVTLQPQCQSSLFLLQLLQIFTYSDAPDTAEWLHSSSVISEKPPPGCLTNWDWHDERTD